MFDSQAVTIELYLIHGRSQLKLFVFDPRVVRIEVVFDSPAITIEAAFDSRAVTIEFV